jgi:hypothetical protein
MEIQNHVVVIIPLPIRSRLRRSIIVKRWLYKGNKRKGKFRPNYCFDLKRLSTPTKNVFIYKKIASDSLYAFNEQDLYKKWHSFERKFNIIHTKLRHNNNSLIIYTGIILETSLFDFLASSKECNVDPRNIHMTWQWTHSRKRLRMCEIVCLWRKCAHGTYGLPAKKCDA